MPGAGEIRIGTSGWHYRHWRGPFYPAGLRAADLLPYYARHFDTVELNTTFYRLAPVAAVAAWRQAVPRGFLFTAKGSRFITHMKHLKDPEATLPRYFERLEPLGDGLGPIVFQLPPRFAPDRARFAAFLQALPEGRRYAFEFRDERWFDPRIYALLRQHGAALCLYDYAGRTAPPELTADFVYVRLHGPGGPYQGSYDQRALVAWAERMRAWQADGLSVYCYFDNDEAGNAPQNAADLVALVGGAG